MLAHLISTLTLWSRLVSEHHGFEEIGSIYMQSKDCKVMWIFDCKIVDAPDLPVAQGSTVLFFFFFFNLPLKDEEKKKRERQQKNKYLPWDHTANECAFGHYILIAHFSSVLVWRMKKCLAEKFLFPFICS